MLAANIRTALRFILFFLKNKRSISTCLMILSKVSELNCHILLITEAKLKRNIKSQTYFKIKICIYLFICLFDCLFGWLVDLSVSFSD